MGSAVVRQEAWMDFLDRSITQDLAVLASVRRQLDAVGHLQEVMRKQYLGLQGKYDDAVALNERLLIAQADLRKEIERKTQAMAELEGELTRARYALQVRQQEIERIYRSRSWRLTRPVRSIGRLLRSVRDRLKMDRRSQVADGESGKAVPATLQSIDVVLKGKHVQSLAGIGRRLARQDKA